MSNRDTFASRVLARIDLNSSLRTTAPAVRRPLFDDNNALLREALTYLYEGVGQVDEQTDELRLLHTAEPLSTERATQLLKLVAVRGQDSGVALNVLVQSGAFASVAEVEAVVRRDWAHLTGMVTR
jgi:rRNA processing protein Krr1/Pno1